MEFLEVNPCLSTIKAGNLMAEKFFATVVHARSSESLTIVTMLSYIKIGQV